MEKCYKKSVVLELFLGLGSDLTVYTFNEFREAAARLDIEGIEEFIDEYFEDSEVYYELENDDKIRKYIKSRLTDKMIETFVQWYEGDEINYALGEAIEHNGSMYVKFKDMRKLIEYLDN